MNFASRCAGAVIAFGILAVAPAVKAQTGKAPELPVLVNKWTGDLDEMVKHRTIRVLVIPSRSTFFVDKGTQRGTAYEAMKAFEREYDQKQKSEKLKVHIVFIPVGAEEALDYLRTGRGDIITAPIIVTPERREQVDFTLPVWKDVREVIVTGPGVAPVRTPEDLSGRTIFVNPMTVYGQHLKELSARLEKAGKPPVRIQNAPAALQDEDLLEMVNAGVVEATVTRGYMVELWRQVFTGLSADPGAVLASGEELAWAVRKDSPKLKAALDDFIKKNGQGSAFGNELFRRYFKNTKFIRNSTSAEEMKKFNRTVAFFKKYGAQYEMDYLLLAAQGYQESRLDQSQRNPSGALGVMQVLPSTGAAMKVGDITLEEANIHAGVKFLRFMLDQYFKGQPMDQLNKGLFAFASYNAGPGRVSGLRKEAERRGLNPNVWFNNVEVVAAQRVGQELVGYVSNIYKYYIAYTLLAQQDEARDQAKEKIESGNKK